MLVVRVTENVRAVQSSYYSSCPCADIRSGHGRHHHVQMATKRDAVSDDGLMFMENQTNVPLNKAEELSSNWRTNSQ
jgi:hypothetical protein